MHILKKLWMAWLGFRLIVLALVGVYYTQASFWVLLLWQIFSLLPALAITAIITKRTSPKGISETHAKLMITSCLVIAVYWANASVQLLLKSYESAPLGVTVYYAVEMCWLGGIFFGLFWWLKKSKTTPTP